MYYIITKYWTEEKKEFPRVNKAIEQKMDKVILNSKDELKKLRSEYSKKHNGAYIYFMYTVYDKNLKL